MDRGKFQPRRPSQKPLLPLHARKLGAANGATVQVVPEAAALGVVEKVVEVFH
jgi:hypothetical protein